MKVVVLTGGVGGARFLRGIVDAIDPATVTAIVNIGDDLEVLGLSVSPDLDSVLYALAGISDEARGWGRADETWNALASVEALGGESWFRLGDRDLGLHVVRTSAVRTMCWSCSSLKTANHFRSANEVGSLAGESAPRKTAGDEIAGRR